MKKVILETAKYGYFTNLKEIFEIMGGKQKKYNWLITEYECNEYPSKQITLEAERVLLSGEELSDIADKFDIQFIWGVISGIPKTIPEELISGQIMPDGEYYETLWGDSVKMKHPLAEVEIIAWDSTLAIVMSNDEALISKFRKCYDIEEK